MLLRITTCLSLLKLICTHKMDGFIVGGENSTINNFPHVAFLHIKCKTNGAIYCGASIVNQVILLTAAHCLHDCHENHTFSIRAYTGHVEKYKGHENMVIGFRVHEHYMHHNFTNDIAMLVLGRELKFGEHVRRVVLMKRLPKYDTAVIAGWGWIDDHNTKTDILHFTSQKVLKNKACLKRVPGIPRGTICGYNPSGSHPQRGDSGSALLIYHHIQIGIASYFRRNFSNKTLVYTDITHFYDWIQETAQSLACKYKTKKVLMEEDSINDRKEDENDNHDEHRRITEEEMDNNNSSISQLEIL